MDDFDHCCSVFTQRMRVASEWKHHYYGAAYTTRLMQAIKDVREACDELENKLIELREIDGPII